MLIQRQAPLAVGALAACAVMASGAVLLRGQILTFASWPHSDVGGHAEEVAIPGQAPFLARGGMPGRGTGGTRYGGKTSDRAAVRDLLGGHGGVSAVALPAGGGSGLATGSDGAPAGPGRSPRGGGSGPSATGTGPTSSSEGTRPLSGYMPGGGSAGSGGGGTSGQPYTPVSGSAAPATSSPRTTADNPYIFTPTGEGQRTSSSAATPQAAQDAPAADSGPVVSSADNAPSQPTDSTSTPTPPSPPTESTPPTDPTPTPPADPAPADPTPPADPAPADPAPPAADPAPADPAPSGDDPSTTTQPSGDAAAAAAIPSSVS